jgi:uncharacterized protein (DUF58 family)
VSGLLARIRRSITDGRSAAKPAGASAGPAEAVPREVLRQVRRIEMRTRGLVDTVFGGEYHSVFRGQGIEFSDVREYQDGDDVRSIDWNVTARTGQAYVKKHVEERELNLLLAVDMSGSGQFGTRSRFKAELAAEIAAVLALSATRNNDRVGLVLFTDRVEHVVPPRKGRRHVLRLIRDVLAFEPASRGTDLGGALDYAARLLRHRGIIFVLSDFLTPFAADTAGFAGEPGNGDAQPAWEKQLRMVSRRHDVVAITVSDPAEERLAPVGLLVLRDPETGREVAIDTSREAVQSGFTDAVATERIVLRRVFRRLGVDEIETRTDTSYVRPLLAFFRRRERMMRR